MTAWQELGQFGRVDAVRSVWFPGCSAFQIAQHFEGATRNAVIGIYNRYGKRLLADKPLRSPATANADTRHKNSLSKDRRRSNAFLSVFEPKKSKPLAAPPVIAEESIHGKPMMMLGPKECRWAVNEADREQLHLFCGLPAEGSYCAHHVTRAVKPFPITNRSRG